MNIQTQNQILIKLLEDDYKKRGTGVDRVETMNTYHIVDVPTRKSDIIPYFKNKGFDIVNLRAKPGKGTRVALYKLIPTGSIPYKEKAQEEAEKSQKQPIKVLEWFTDSEGREYAKVL